VEDAVSHDTLSSVQKVLAEALSTSTERFPPERRLDELGIDSLSVIEIVFQLENVHGITIPLGPGAVTTVDDVVNMVDRAKAETSRKAA
jgi:acyl carrier protein